MVPTERQRYNYAAHKRNKAGSPNINIDGDNPENFPDTVDIEIPVASMRLFITTKHLMSMASKHVRLLHADATYKLVLLGYPVYYLESKRGKFFFASDNQNE